MTIQALILAPSADDDHVVTGLTLSERARRTAHRAGIPDTSIFLVRDGHDVTRHKHQLPGAVLVIDARTQVVAPPLIAPLLDEPDRAAVATTASGAFAGAAILPPQRACDVIARLADALPATMDDLRIAIGPAEDREVTHRARHPAATPKERSAADDWQMELCTKPLDAPIVRYFYRPASRPFTRWFLQSSLSPNAITVVSVAFSVLGAIVGAQPGYWLHVLGMALVVFGGVLDGCDGEVARLRLEGSAAGAWLDAIGDEIARVSLLISLGWHVSHRYPQLPIFEATAVAVTCLLITLALIFWYCIVIAKDANTQAYGKDLGINRAEDDTEVKPSPLWKSVIFGIISQAARRDFTDLAVLVLAILSLPQVAFASMAAGAAIGLLITVPMHIRIVMNRRNRIDPVP